MAYDAICWKLERLEEITSSVDSKIKSLLESYKIGDINDFELLESLSKVSDELKEADVYFPKFV